MNHIALKAENLGKMYVITHQAKEQYATLRDILTNAFVRAGKKIAYPFTAQSTQGTEHNLTKEEFWALKGADFEISQGDRVGIIGRNGAGKSTLLKVLSRITEPTEGRFATKGRVASLLEVGTGFHPELTGKENIFLNGAILGMTRNEIKKKFDEIVAFAEVEKFIDTPVKRYSSGMHVRLGFAVAAHLEPEILIVDEVLAVGDAEFQNKCLGKMNEVAKSGRTILFVSHNMGSIRKLCNKAILLKKGEMTRLGDVEEVTYFYEKQFQEKREDTVTIIPHLGITINKITLNDGGIIKPLSPLKINIELLSEKEYRGLALHLTISNPTTDGYLFSSSTKLHKNIDVLIKPGINQYECTIKKFALCSDKYSLGLGIDTPLIKMLFKDDNIMTFEVIEVVLPDATLPTIPPYGHILLEHEWKQIE